MAGSKCRDLNATHTYTCVCFFVVALSHHVGPHVFQFFVYLCYSLSGQRRRDGHERRDRKKCEETSCFDASFHCCTMSAPTTPIRLLLVRFRLRKNGAIRSAWSWSRPELSGAFRSRPALSRIVRSRLESFGVVRSRPESSGVVRSRSESESS